MVAVINLWINKIADQLYLLFFQKREIEMQQKLELEEETCTELKQVFASLQQQVDFKRDKLKRLNSKLQSIRQEIRDNHEVYLKDRQEIEEANDEAAM